jgi:hypothetical protein
MKSMPMCATGSRCANAHLLRPASDQDRKVGQLLATAKVALRSYGQAQNAPARFTLRNATIAYSV